MRLGFEGFLFFCAEEVFKEAFILSFFILIWCFFSLRCLLRFFSLFLFFGCLDFGFFLFGRLLFCPKNVLKHAVLLGYLRICFRPFFRPFFRQLFKHFFRPSLFSWAHLGGAFGRINFILKRNRTFLNFLFFGHPLLSLLQLSLPHRSPLLDVLHSHLGEGRMSEQELLGFKQNVILFLFIQPVLVVALVWL